MAPAPLTGGSPHLPLWSPHFFPSCLPEEGPQVAHREAFVSLSLLSPPSDKNPGTVSTGAGFQEPPQCVATSGPWEPSPSALRLLPILQFVPGSQQPWLPLPVSQLRQQKLRGVKQLPQGHAATIWRNQDLNPNPCSGPRGEGSRLWSQNI